MHKVDVITGTRAEYGLLRPVLQKLWAAGDFAPRLVVTGSHLSAKYGLTVQEIEADGFPIRARLDILSTPVPEGRSGTAWRTLLAMDAFLGHFSPEQERPDAVLLLGDRYEMLAAAEAAALLDIPVVHISGGDVTRGADDDWFRHSITKMAKLHFPSCEAYRRRLLRMGEQPGRVFNVGGLGDENIRSMTLLTRPQLAESLEWPELAEEQPFALVTFHPETACAMQPPAQVETLLAAVEAHPELLYLFTKANADAGGEEMNRRVEAFCQTHSNARLFASLGTLRYLSAVKQAALVLGNSSSGVVETPSLGTPTVDIGQRQAGRITGANVLHCAMDTAAIRQAMEEALTPAFRQKAGEAVSPYNGGNTSGRILAVLRRMLQAGALAGPKEFYDGPDDAPEEETGTWIS